MTILTLLIAGLLQSDGLVLVERPLAEWRYQSEAAQCGLIEARIEHKSKPRAKRPEVLKGEVRYVRQKRTLDKELATISSQIEGVYDMGIACESASLLVIVIVGNAPGGRKTFEVFVNDRLEISVHEK
jgi:hypothetical protein